MADASNAEYGAWMKTLREHAGLSQARLAGQIGVDRQRIIRWEKGDNLPGARYLLALLTACGVRLQTEEPPPVDPRRPETGEQLVRAVEEMTAQVVALRDLASRLADGLGDAPPRLADEAAS